MTLKRSCARGCPLAADASIVQEAQRSLEMVVCLQRQVSSDVTKSRRQLPYGGVADTGTDCICVRQRNFPFFFLIIPKVPQQSAIGSVLKQIRLKAETMLIQCAACSTPASVPSVLIHVKRLHMATFCFSCQRFCRSQENFGFPFC